jgi:TetR/AcrR family transcriptional regulator, transcriptional repressor for nem operon
MARTKDFDEDEVLAKAVSLFWYKGYNGTSMQDLVDGLGISRSSLYDTYGDKHTLFIKALESYKESATGKMCDIVTNAVSAKEAIKRLLEITTMDLVGDCEHKGCFMTNATVEVAPHDKEVSDIVCQNDQQVEDAFYKAIEKGQMSGEITSKQDARALARFIINNVKGMRVSAKSTTDKGIFDDIIKLTLSALD